MNRPRVDGNSVQLLINGEQYYPRVFEAMAHAREEILLETFIIFDDKVGQQLQQVLIDAARRGVRVEVAVDGYGTADLPAPFIAAMTDAGVSFHAFDPQPRLVGMRTNLFRRLHRKIVVVDGERAFIGGINYSADHLGDFGAMAKQDYAVEVTGPVVAQVHAASKRLMSPVLQPPSAVRPLTEPAGASSAVLIERDNGLRSTDIEAHYLQAFRSARQRIVVANAYFFPGYRLMRELRNASRRGVEVQLILQGQPDMRWVRALSRLLYNYLLRDGVAIHEYCQRPLHGKVALVDDQWATVGSSNLDPLSLSFNLKPTCSSVIVPSTINSTSTCRRWPAINASRSPRAHGPWLLVAGAADLRVFPRDPPFPRIAGWFPAHRQRLRSVQPEAEVQGDYHEGKT